MRFVCVCPVKKTFNRDSKIYGAQVCTASRPAFSHQRQELLSRPEQDLSPDGTTVPVPTLARRAHTSAHEHSRESRHSSAQLWCDSVHACTKAGKYTEGREYRLPRKHQCRTTPVTPTERHRLSKQIAHAQRLLQLFVYLVTVPSFKKKGSPSSEDCLAIAIGCDSTIARAAHDADAGRKADEAE